MNTIEEEYRVIFITKHTITKLECEIVNEIVYEISNYGNVRKKVNDKEYVSVKGSISNGYILYYLDGYIDSAHRLVAKAFLEQPPEGHTIVDHIDRNRSNNHISNLRWATPIMNQQNRECFKNYIRERTDGKQIKYRAYIRRDGKTYSKTFTTREQAEEWIRSEDYEDVKRNKSPTEGHIHTFLSAKNEMRFRAMRRINGKLYSKIFGSQEEAQEWINTFKDPTTELPESTRRKQGAGNISMRETSSGEIRYDAKIKKDKKQHTKTFKTKEEAQEWLDSFNSVINKDDERRNL